MATVAALSVRALRLCSILWLVAVSAACRDGADVRGPFSGRIVDADTGQPIKGAVVVVAWTHLMTYFEGGRREVDSRETITDRQGRWDIPERITPPWEGGLAGVLRRFYVFAAGYDVVDSSGTPSDEYQLTRASRVTTMRRLATPHARCDGLTYVSGQMSADTAGRSPRFMVAIAGERARLRCSEQQRSQP